MSDYRLAVQWIIDRLSGRETTLDTTDLAAKKWQRPRSHYWVTVDRRSDWMWLMKWAPKKHVQLYPIKTLRPKARRARFWRFLLGA